MATLSGNKIKNTYQSLVKFSDNGNITTSAKQLTDGFGNNSPIYVSTTQVGIGVTPESGLNLHVYGDAKIGSNLTVIGNLVVEGSTTTVGTDTLTVKDPLIVLANNNTSTDAVDIGFYGKYTPSGTTLYSGLFREALTGKYRLFKGLETEPTTTVNLSGTGYAKADLIIGNIETNGLSEGSSLFDFTKNVAIDGTFAVTGIAEFDSTINHIQINTTVTKFTGISGSGFNASKLEFFKNIDLQIRLNGEDGEITTLGTLSAGGITSTGNLGVNGNISAGGTGSFTGQVTIPQTPTSNTHAASKGYVDTQIGANNELSEVLANGNTTGGTDIAITAGDKITNFTSTGIDDNATSNVLTIADTGLTVGNSGTSRFTDTNLLPLQLSSGVDVTTQGSTSALLGIGGLNGSTYTDAIQIGGLLNANGQDGKFFLNLSSSTSTYPTVLEIDSSGEITNTMSGGKVITDTNGHITSFQTLDTATAGGRFIGKSNRGILGSIHIEQTTTGADGGYIGFETSPNGSTTPTEKMRLDADGNLGIGVTPEAWTVFKTLQIGQASAFVGRISSNQTDVSTNFYYDGVEKRITTGYTQRYTQTSDGNHQFWTAGTDSADSAITFSKKFEILNNGNATFAGSVDINGSGNNSIAGDLYFGVNADIFKSSGTLGINADNSTFSGNVSINSTSAPVKNLVVEGDSLAYATIRILSNSTAHGAEIEFGDSSDVDYGSITQFASSAGEGGRMRFRAGGIETMNLKDGNGTFEGNLKINSYLNINGVAAGTSTYQEWRNNDVLFAYNGSAAAIISGGSSTDYVAGNTTGGTSVILATNNTERFKISGTGDIGINLAPASGIRVLIKGHGTTSGTRSLQANNGSNQDMFYINDDGSGFLKASAWTYGSDISLKENITDVENGVDMVLQMKPKHFDYIEGPKNNLGFIAQDIQKIIPEAVSVVNEENETLGLKTDFLVPYLVKAIQEVKAEVDLLKQQCECK